ncbi:hypothetical protein E2B89_09660 [Salmonella enterica]|nr:hypothetical protein [Salmonella enterica]EBH8948401.1 hypothetical protein [Salmonella enterica subsp. diarizonae serovar 48:i:z]ECE5794483.1 hypothetical protein [Salmonella enterica subsp. diarizonae]EAT4549292.1 hypothetical protein [Salmonella enterica]EAT6912038.1 hypothetical protein [Salmonella enterica]
MTVYNRCTLFSTLSATYRVNQFHSVSEFRVIVIMIIWILTYFLNSDEIFCFFINSSGFMKSQDVKYIYVHVLF